MAESVELATILLTDLVGSTRLATSVGPVRADQLREEHFELLRDAIASSGGQEVKNTGDGLMVAFSSASAAVQCAVAMQQLFERRYRDAEQALHVRIGLGAGESTVKDGDYFGMPSIEAARLCAQAPADGILISARVKMLAGRCEGVEFSSAGELELKGFPDPVEAFSVSWAPLAEEAGGRGSLAAAGAAALGSAGQLRGASRGARGARGSDDARALGPAPGGAALRRAGDRQDPLASYAAHDAHAAGFAVCWGRAPRSSRCPMSRGSSPACDFQEPTDCFYGQPRRLGGRSALAGPAAICSSTRACRPRARAIARARLRRLRATRGGPGRDRVSRRNLTPTRNLRAKWDSRG